MSTHYLAPQARTLAQATQNADVAISATALSIQFTPFDGSYVTVRVDRRYKGQGIGATLVIHQPGGLRPMPDWKTAVIAESASQPLMLPGDRFVLLLKSVPDSTDYEVQDFTGIFKLAGGKAAAVLGNPFRNAIDGEVEASLSNQVQDAARQH